MEKWPIQRRSFCILYQIEFYINSKNTKNWSEFEFYFSVRYTCKYATLYKNQDKNLITIAGN